MVTETRKVFVLAALIVSTGVATVEMTRNLAKADPVRVAASAAEYAGKRVDGAFGVVSNMPSAGVVAIGVARKGRQGAWRLH